MDFTSRDFDLEENVFFFFNEERDALSFVLEWDTSDKFYHKLLNVSIIILFFKDSFVCHVFSYFEYLVKLKFI